LARSLLRAWAAAAALGLILSLTGCREVRVQTIRRGLTTVAGGNQVVIVRTHKALEELGIKAPEIQFVHEFGVALLMGPYRETGWRQIVESIRANENRVRIVAYGRAPADGGEPAAAEYRTYTLWIVPNSVYRQGSSVQVVTPQGELLAETTLR
jgi:hypothetical protein